MQTNRKTLESPQQEDYQGSQQRRSCVRIRLAGLGIMCSKVANRIIWVGPILRPSEFGCWLAAVGMRHRTIRFKLHQVTWKFLNYHSQDVLHTATGWLNRPRITCSSRSDSKLTMLFYSAEDGPRLGHLDTEYKKLSCHQSRKIDPACENTTIPYGSRMLPEKEDWKSTTSCEPQLQHNVRAKR